jgi:hypothetical protein
MLRDDPLLAAAKARLLAAPLELFYRRSHGGFLCAGRERGKFRRHQPIREKPALAIRDLIGGFIYETESMSAEFSFEVDSRRDLVRIKMAGFFRQADVAEFLEARRTAHEMLRCAPNAHLTLNDIRGMAMQPHDIVDAFREMLAAPEYRSRRLAFVVGNTWARSQAIRAIESREARWFDDPAKAEAWLFADELAEMPLRRATG